MGPPAGGNKPRRAWYPLAVRRRADGERSARAAAGKGDIVKITNVKVDMFNWKSEPWETGVGARFGGDRQLGVVTVETDEGVSGNAFLGSSHVGADHYANGLIEYLKPVLVGRNPQDIGAIWWEMWKLNRAVSTNAIGAVDICLWDINGRIAGQPIHRLLGTCKSSVPVYSSTAYWETTEEYAEEAIRFKEMGWTAHKLHPHGDPAFDVEICKAVREAVGDDMKLMLDSMWAYQYEDSLRVGRAIEDLGFYWYEDPLVEEDIYSYVKLHQKLDIPIMSTEYAPAGSTAWLPGSPSTRPTTCGATSPSPAASRRWSGCATSQRAST